MPRGGGGGGGCGVLALPSEADAPKNEDKCAAIPRLPAFGAFGAFAHLRPFECCCISYRLAASPAPPLKIGSPAGSHGKREDEPANRPKSSWYNNHFILFSLL